MLFGVWGNLQYETMAFSFQTNTLWCCLGAPWGRGGICVLDQAKMDMLCCTYLSELHTYAVVFSWRLSSLPILVSNSYAPLHGEPSMQRYMDPQQLRWQSFCSCRPQTMEQFTITSQRCRLIVQSVPVVTENICVWKVGPRHSMSYFNCAI